MRSDKMLFKGIPLYNNKGLNDMISTSRRILFSQVIGPYCMIVGSRILKVNYILDGWDPMKLIQFTTMVQLR
jgi:hypothetical protein